MAEKLHDRCVAGIAADHVGVQVPDAYVSVSYTHLDVYKRQGYSRLPALQGFEALYQADADAALALAREHAWLMASEVRASGVDMSFAPVVDLARGNRAIGDRAFAEAPQVVAAFTRAYVEGMHAAGMAATLKHFPGHGSVLEDTHHAAAVDPRSLDEMREQDLRPFVSGIAAGADAVMMAHVTYPKICLLYTSRCV